MKRLSASGYFLVIAAAFGFSFKSILAKLAYGYGVDAMTLMLMRVFIALPFILATLFFVEGRDGLRATLGEFVLFAFMGIVGIGCAMLFSLYSIEMIDASLSTLVVFTYPAMTVVILTIFLGEREALSRLLPFGATFAGLALVVRADRMDFLALNARGIAFALAAALCFAVYNALSEKVLKEVSPIRLTFYSTAFLAGFFGVIFGGGPYPRALEAWAIAALLAIFSGFLPFLFFLYGMKRIGAARTVIIGSIGPVFTVVWAYLLLGERLDTIQMIGMVMVVAGVATLRLTGRSREASTTGRGAAGVPEVTDGMRIRDTN